VRILVTGAAGYIGGWLVPELNQAGHVVIPLDLSTGCDLNQPGVLSEQIEQHKPDVVVHLAAKYGRVWGEVDHAGTVIANAGLTTTVAHECGRRGIRLVFASSSEVYGPWGAEGVPRGPESLLRPLNLYGLTKVWGEQVCRLYAPDGLTVLRLNMPYGPGQRLGEIGYNALHTFLYQAHLGRPIQVHKGTVRCFTWVGDTVAAIRMLIEETGGGVFNVCRNDDLRDMADVARLACDIAGCTEIIEVDPPDQVTPVKSFDNRGLLELGWSPTVNLEDGARRTHEWVVDQCH
jgi:nucleoside-diphosphate-sugar epimerase